jgi:hypothetical protein
MQNQNPAPAEQENKEYTDLVTGAYKVLRKGAALTGMAVFVATDPTVQSTADKVGALPVAVLDAIPTPPAFVNQTFSRLPVLPERERHAFPKLPLIVSANSANSANSVATMGSLYLDNTPRPV